LINGDFEIPDEAFVPLGWDSAPKGPNMYLTTFRSDGAPGSNGSYVGRVVSQSSNSTISVFQPVVFCPNTVYRLTAWFSESSSNGNCTITFKANDQPIVEVAPQQAWQGSQALYTAGTTAEDVSQDLNITITCTGTPDANGRIFVELDDLDLTAV